MAVPQGTPSDVVDIINDCWADEYLRKTIEEIAYAFRNSTGRSMPRLPSKDPVPDEDAPDDSPKPKQPSNSGKNSSDEDSPSEKKSKQPPKNVQKSKQKDSQAMSSPSCASEKTIIGKPKKHGNTKSRTPEKKVR